MKLLRLFVLFLFIPALFALDVMSDSTYLTRISEAVNLSFHEKFDFADSLLLDIQNETGDSTDILFFRLAIMYSRMKDREDFRDKDTFLNKLDKCEAEIQLNEIDAYRQYMLGMIWIYRAMILMDTGGSPLSLLKNFRNASGLLEEASKDEVVRPDAYLGLGTYKYFKSAKAGILRSVGIISDEREDGIEMLKFAAKESKFSYWPAVHSLILSYLEEDNFEKADSIVKIMLSENGTSKTPLWDAIAINMKMENWSGVAEYSERLLKMLPMDGNGYNRLQVYYFLTYSNEKQGKVAKAIEYARKGLFVKLDDISRDRHGDNLEYMRDFLEDNDANQIDR